MTSGSAHPQGGNPSWRPRGNKDFPWDEFDSERYYERNYLEMHEVDARILRVTRDFFVRAYAEDRPERPWRGIDVGTGANLYPALSLLPFCERIRLHEWSKHNVDWLSGEISGGFREAWDQFWGVLTEREPYAAVPDPRGRFEAMTEIVWGSVFELLPERIVQIGGPWDVGTMYFGAESMTEDEDEFQRAVEYFLRALNPGAPFATAFMKNSEGYPVGGVKFPAVKVDAEKVSKHLDSLVYDFEVQEVEPDLTLRHGYEGMLIATGRRSG